MPAAGDRLLPATRALLAAGIALTVGTGAALWPFPADMPSYWAWQIRGPLSAALFGAGATLRFREELCDGAATALYVGGLVAFLVTLGLVARSQSAASVAT